MLGEARMLHLMYIKYRALSRLHPAPTILKEPAVQSSPPFDHALNAAVVRLDVRPILGSGRDPFAEIMAVACNVPAGGSLVLIAPFNPMPLSEVMATKGFTSQAAQTAAGVWEITFVRLAAHPTPHPQPQSQVGFRSEGADRHVDARGLDAAGAVEAVLAALGTLDASDRLIAHLGANIDRLYPELLRLGWGAAYVPGDVGEVRLEISRASD